MRHEVASAQYSDSGNAERLGQRVAYQRFRHELGY
jgi:hypothetical protein